MSAIDGFSDDEWGAWGKSDTTVTPTQSQSNHNGYGNDNFTKERHYDKPSNFAKQSNDRRTYDNGGRANNNYQKRNDEGDYNGYRNQNRRNDNRDDSKENRGNYRHNGRDDFQRDNSRENRNFSNRGRDDYKRDNSRENYNNKGRNEYKRDGSRENRQGGYRNRIDDDRGGFRNRNDGERGNNYRQNKRDDENGWDDNPRNNDYRKRNDSRERRPQHRNDRQDDDWNENKPDSHRESKRNDLKRDNGRDFCDDFQRNTKIDDGEGFSSRTFVRGKKNSELDDKDDDIAAPKRATFIPNDDQEDYELHVNSGINFDNYDKIPVEVTGDNAPSSISNFNDLDLPDFLKTNIESLRYSKLTPVQKYAVPIISANRDLMACAQTGSGKTAAFLIPIIKSLQENITETPKSQVAFPKALIMAPTRELCRQIFTAARHLCRGSDVKCAYIYGGIEMNKSRRNIQVSGCDILVATPGRLIHFLELIWISLKHMKYFVLDEADRMLESEGFYESVNKIYKDANISGGEKTIQISMFSATFPSEIQTLARNLLDNYLFLAVGVVGAANSDVKQEIILTDPKDKINTAIEFIKTIPEEKTLIFVESKRMADFFGIKLGYLGYKATTIHGDREQEQREIALNDFKSGRVNFMVATNVAARGLDIPKVDNVINIDMPSDIDTYVHRIGRTGRCGNYGRAISFFDDTKDLPLASGLVSKLEEANQEVADWLRQLCDGSGSRRPNYSRDTRTNVQVSKFMDNPNDDFMKGSNVDYDDGKPNSEWLDD